MKINSAAAVATAKQAALEVLHHNMRGPFSGLPKSAGWGYPEPYTRDCLICGLGILVSGNERLIASSDDCAIRLPETKRFTGTFHSLVHDPENRGASDTTPLFLMVLSFFRKATGDADFLSNAMRLGAHLDGLSESGRPYTGGAAAH